MRRALLAAAVGAALLAGCTPTGVSVDEEFTTATPSVTTTISPIVNSDPTTTDDDPKLSAEDISAAFGALFTKGEESPFEPGSKTSRITEYNSGHNVVCVTQAWGASAATALLYNRPTKEVKDGVFTLKVDTAKPGVFVFRATPNVKVETVAGIVVIIQLCEGTIPANAERALTKLGRMAYERM